MEALVVNESKNRTHAKKIQKHLDAVIHGLTKSKLRNSKLLKSKTVTLVFLDPVPMKKINKQFRGKNKPTDVLSFAPVEEESIGEILFCLDVLKKQAKDQGHSLENEFLYMLIHGVLHLLGYDHELSIAEEKLMFKIQDQLFAQLTA
jgi:probable rRNA maturation factor